MTYEEVTKSMRIYAKNYTMLFPGEVDANEVIRQFWTTIPDWTQEDYMAEGLKRAKKWYNSLNKEIKARVDDEIEIQKSKLVVMAFAEGIELSDDIIQNQKDIMLVDIHNSIDSDS